MESNQIKHILEKNNKNEKFVMKIRYIRDENNKHTI